MSKKEKVVPPSAGEPVTSKIITIADVCTDGCRFNEINDQVDQEVMRSAKLEKALEAIIAVVASHTTLSNFRTGMAAIKTTAEEALK